MHRNILVVDDDEHILTLITAFLEQAGYNVQTCTDGYSALSVIITGDFDLVILDISMPYMNGMKVLKSLKADADVSKIPVIMLTSSDSLKDIQQAGELGVKDYVLKPPKKEDILERAERLLGGRPQFIEVKLDKGDQNNRGSFDLKLRLKSLSRKGMVLVGNVELASETVLSNLKIPSLEDLKLDFKGFKVKECSANEDGTYSYHVSFSGMSRSDLDKVADKVMKDSFAHRNKAKAS